MSYLLKPDTSSDPEVGLESPHNDNDPGNGLPLAAPSFSVAVLQLWRKRRFIVKAACLGLLLTAGLALVLPREYESTTRLMPPDKQSLTGLALLAGSMKDSVGELASDALGLKTSGALVTGILRSRTVADRLITENGLMRVYKTRLMLNARKTLVDKTEISEDRKSGIITVTVTDNSPQRAAALARSYAEQANRVMGELDSSAAHRERVFIEDRLKAVKQDLDGATKELSEFSSKNTAVDPQAQGKAMVESAAALQGELIAARAQLSGLEQIYTEKHFRVRALRARIGELQRQLGNIRGTDESIANDANGSGDIGGYPSIRKLPLLGLTYYDLYRRAKIQETVFEILTKQYELAKVAEAKELPTIRVLDEADVPERKSAPKRIQMAVFGGVLSAIFAMVWVIAFYRWENMVTEHPLKLYSLEIQQGLKDDLFFLRKSFNSPGGRIRIPLLRAKGNGSPRDDGGSQSGSSSE